MSGAEVIGLISAIISIVDASLKVYNAVRDVSGLPPAIRDVASRLPLIQGSLQSAMDGIAEDSQHSEQSFEDMKTCLKSCHQKAQALEEAFRDLLPPPDAKGTERVLKAIRATKQGSKIQGLERGIVKDLQVLTANHAIRSATRAQMKELIESVERLEAHQEDQGSRPSILIRNTGSGTQIIQSADGDQNVSGGPQLSGVFNGPFNFRVGSSS